MRYRFLKKEDFPRLHRAFIKAFSDYAVKMEPSEAQFLEMLTRRGIRYDLSVGAFDNDEIAGFNMNALDHWRDRLTVYDLGTGVLPQYRGRGIAGKLFEFSFPKLKQASAGQYLLEVIESNAPAIKTYKKIGFRESRKLECFRLSNGLETGKNEIHLSSERGPDWDLFQSFWDWEPSWQNSINSIKRSREKNRLICAFSEGLLVGYGIVYPSSGDIPQIAVSKERRRTGIGSRILQRLQVEIEAGQFGRVINIDGEAAATLSFCKAAGMEKIVDQHEMLLEIF